MNNTVLQRWTWKLFCHDQSIYSPDLSKDGSCSESDEHRLSIRSSDHLHLTCFYDVHLTTHLPLWIREIRTELVTHKRKKKPEIRSRTDSSFQNSLYLFADIIPGQVNDRAKAFQHVKDHLSVAALQGWRGQGQIRKKKAFPQITSHHRHLPTWKRGTLLTME